LYLLRFIIPDVFRGGSKSDISLLLKDACLLKIMEVEISPGFYQPLVGTRIPCKPFRKVAYNRPAAWPALPAFPLFWKPRNPTVRPNLPAGTSLTFNHQEVLPRARVQQGLCWSDCKIEDYMTHHEAPNRSSLLY
jgi:hypothetical protein